MTHEEPTMADGLWLIQKNGGKRQRIAEMNDLIDPLTFAKLAIDADELAGYLRALIHRYFDDTVQITKNNNFRYVLPPCQDMAFTILKFIAMTSDEKEKARDIALGKIRHIDDEGNIIDDIGRKIYDKDSLDAVAMRLHEAEKQVEREKELLAAKCIDEV